MDPFDLDSSLAEIISTGNNLYSLISSTLESNDFSDAPQLREKLNAAWANLIDLPNTLKSIPIGFSEIIDNANKFEGIAAVILDKIGYSKPGTLEARKIKEILKGFRNLVQEHAENYALHSKIMSYPRNKNSPEFLAQLDFFNLRISQTEDSLSKQLKQTGVIEDSIRSLQSSLSDTNLSASELRSRIDEKLLETSVYLEGKLAEVNEVVGVIAAKSIVGSYEKSADIEKTSADALRIASIVFMVLVMIFVGFTFYGITTGEFSWEKSALKLICSLLFSVPAAYLARESAKHRQQQYTHLQTSLDLKAVGPYIATLPKEQQDTLKAEIAQRMFAPKTFDHVTKESYPINTQELVLALVDRINGRKAAKAEGTSLES
ncbi:UNVERIFIED_ORG: hypothetical protein JN05_01266 [Zoogloea ramigera]|uniref:Uncharacterized protein n=1 Tax=Duganella zoogloeoides TaxID=75659 RepID=A0ABZ0Y5X8_9BURK|nr:hypothetical protein [Duganella zoogloeoides]WQH06872.1 hypothetical protein SR858_11240 [Duganella zoogloeoides]